MILVVSSAVPVGAAQQTSGAEGARQRYEEGNWLRAVEGYRAVEDRLSAADLVLYGEGLLRMKQYDAAEAVLRRVEEQAGPGGEETFLRARGALLFLQASRGTPEQAVADLEALVEKEPESYWAKIYLARALKSRGTWDEALSVLFEAKGIVSRDYWVHFEIGEIYEQLFMFDLAMEAYEESLFYNPRYAQAINNLGYCYKEKSVLYPGVTLYSYAVDRYLEAIAIQPDNAGFHYNLGNAYTHLEKIDKAFEAYSRAVELDPKFAKAHFNLGRTWQRYGKLREAIREFELYIEYGTQPIFDYVQQPEVVQKEIDAMKKILERDSRD